ncbi:MAG: hypothetical protein AAGA93_05195 [Actinomycetota bacterium]
MNQTRQRFAMGAMVLAALLAITIGAVYQDDDRLDDVSVVGGDAQAPVSTTPGGGGGAAVAPGDAAAPAGGPIEAFLPRSGEASACSEAVGVDLIPGYGAELTINGIEIAAEQMNVNLDEDGEITDVITASRSLGQYTFQPDDNCPNGSLLRPVDNVLEVCVFRLSDPTRRCTVQLENVFDAL